ncbi:Cytosolic carboxypeptidase-like protein 5 [Boothiomyces macroporosus]|uniref:Cytosolic carboxypeptidase-like protein 5 n=1 Tax=Boothiomyces macroporosus TaxID=261099 RepID=A0AAD5YA57_9FUNG|nr:Cytosolic carboxypeptidase-like protein 5 [Boothiomyces macroporosus]
MKYSFANFVFDSEFDSGNLGKIELGADVSENATPEISPKMTLKRDKSTKSSDTLLTGLSRQSSNLTRQSSTKLGKDDPIKLAIETDYYFRLWTSPDGSKESPTKNRTWFHFSVEFNPNVPEFEATKPTTVMFHFKNLNKVQRLFTMGLRPVYRNTKDKQWKRIPSTPMTRYVDGALEMQFQFVFSHQKCSYSKEQISMSGTKSIPANPGTYYFAYCVPYSYTTLQNYINVLQDRFRPGSSTKSLIPLLKSLHINNQDVYFHRDVLIRSLNNHNLDILTISSKEGIKNDHEQSIEGLFPVSGSRSRLFNEQKQYFVLSARVHPAETNSSIMLEGFLDFITSNDPQAKLLRSKFVFKVIPMLNPDGVVLGHYRGDKYGLNLNRVYVYPSKEQHPTIWATKMYIEYLAETGQVKYYIDLHGHANKAGSFLFGNWLPNIKQQYEQLLFAKYCLINNPLFDFGECDFAPKAMLPSTIQPPVEQLKDNPEMTKDGTGRVAIYRLTGATHCYTFEANYYGSKLERRLPYSSKCKFYDKNSKVPLDKRFTVADLKAMGRSLAIAVFDVEHPAHQLTSLRVTDQYGKIKLHDWVVDKLKRMYSKSHIPLSEEELSKLEKERSRL